MMTKADKIVEEIAVLLLSIPSNPGHSTMEDAANEALELAKYAQRQWWTTPSPDMTRKLASLRKKLEAA